ncbi:dihydrofolate reductase family protein [Ornithinimicrobium sp. W1679]|uniref:dihydrofolate reductase family protein n=1 Tax=Ornithinimicrobium sp. W1679 TaxID=3418770 RepID=UPI003CF218D6
MTSPPPQVGTGPLGPADLHRWYAVPEGGGDRPWVRASFVTTLDGRVSGPDGRSASLNAGSPGDHAVFDHLRSWAQVVVVGAGTARTEEYEPVPGALLVLLTRDGVLPDSVGAAGERREAGGDGDAGGNGQAGRDEELGQGGGDGVLVLGGRGRSLAPGEVLAELARRGLRRILLEGGPQVFGDWLDARAVDELCLTVRPVLAGGDGPLLVPPTTALGGLLGRATHLLTWGGDVLVRTRLR